MEVEAGKVAICRPTIIKPDNLVMRIYTPIQNARPSLPVLRAMTHPQPALARPKFNPTRLKIAWGTLTHLRQRKQISLPEPLARNKALLVIGGFLQAVRVSSSNLSV
jgi:hypothetical protein